MKEVLQQLNLKVCYKYKGTYRLHSSYLIAYNYKGSLHFKLCIILYMQETKHYRSVQFLLAEETQFLMINYSIILLLHLSVRSRMFTFVILSLKEKCNITNVCPLTIYFRQISPLTMPCTWREFKDSLLALGIVSPNSTFSGRITYTKEGSQELL